MMCGTQFYANQRRPLVCTFLFLRTSTRIEACSGIGNKFASRSFAENWSSDGLLRQFCKFTDTPRVWPI